MCKHTKTRGSGASPQEFLDSLRWLTVDFGGELVLKWLNIQTEKEPWRESSPTPLPPPPYTHTHTLDETLHDDWTTFFCYFGTYIVEVLWDELCDEVRSCYGGFRGFHDTGITWRMKHSCSHNSVVCTTHCTFAK